MRKLKEFVLVIRREFAWYALGRAFRKYDKFDRLDKYSKYKLSTPSGLREYQRRSGKIWHRINKGIDRRIKAEQALADFYEIEYEYNWDMHDAVKHRLMERWHTKH